MLMGEKNEELPVQTRKRVWVGCEASTEHRKEKCKKIVMENSCEGCPFLRIYWYGESDKKIYSSSTLKSVDRITENKQKVGDKILVCTQDKRVLVKKV